MRRTVRSVCAAVAALAAVVSAAVLPGQAPRAGADTVSDQMVAYWDGATGWGVYVRDVQTGEVQHLLTDAATATPAISPDGSKLAYFCSHGTNGVIEILDPSTGAVLDEVSGGGSFSFSPDGRQLVAQVSGDIDIFDLATRQWTKIGEGANPRWSPDGTKIAYGSIGSPRNRRWTMNPDGSDPQLLAGATPGVDDAVQSWAWSADSRTIVFAGLIVDANDSAGNADLYFIDRDGRRRWPITATPAVNETFTTVAGSLHATVPGAPTGLTAAGGLSKPTVRSAWSPPGRRCPARPVQRRGARRHPGRPACGPSQHRGSDVGDCGRARIGPPVLPQRRSRQRRRNWPVVSAGRAGRATGRHHDHAHLDHLLLPVRGRCCARDRYGHPRRHRRPRGRSTRMGSVSPGTPNRAVPDPWVRHLRPTRLRAGRRARSRHGPRPGYRARWHRV